MCSWGRVHTQDSHTLGIRKKHCLPLPSHWKELVTRAAKPRACTQVCVCVNVLDKREGQRDILSQAGGEDLTQRQLLLLVSSRLSVTAGVCRANGEVGSAELG